MPLVIRRRRLRLELLPGIKHLSVPPAWGRRQTIFFASLLMFFYGAAALLTMALSSALLVAGNEDVRKTIWVGWRDGVLQPTVPSSPKEWPVYWPPEIKGWENLQ